MQGVATKLKTALILHGSQEGNYIPPIRQLLGQLGIDRVIASGSKLSVNAINLRVETYKVDYIFIANMEVVYDLVKDELGRARKIDPEMWAGSVLGWQDGFTVPTMIMLPLHYYHTKPWGAMVMEQHFNKLLNGVKVERLPEDNPFTYVVDSNVDACLAILKDAVLIAIDIETNKHINMDMVGYCARMRYGSPRAFIVDMGQDITYRQMDFIRRANDLPQPKVFHNGCYDNQFFARYRVPVRNYTLDTEYLFYSIYSELPRSLAFVSAFYNPIARYWKQMVGKDRAKYCALDCYNTLVSLEVMMLSIPDYAISNYSKVFPLTTVTLWCNLHGLAVDREKLSAAKVKAEAEVAQMQEDFYAMCGGLEVNINSPKQIAALLYGPLRARKVRVKGKVGGTDATTMAKLAEQDALLAKFIETILNLRQSKKAISTYYNARLFHGRLLYSYRVDGTDTGRLSCNKSSFGWGDKKEESYGAQVQNIPRYMKAALVPDKGYIMGESDKSQSEARCVGYIANDRKLIAALESEDDFYLLCGKLFFDITMEEAKGLRQLIKKIIHGSNYCMRENTFIDSVRKDYGIAPLVHAQQALGRDSQETLFTFANYLLSLYRATYDKLQPWYDRTQLELITKGRLVSALGWTRVFFGDAKSDNTLRAAVAHAPQNLSVAIINTAFVRLFWQLQVPSNGEFLLIAQIHDSILYQIKKGSSRTPEWYKGEVERIMDIAVEFKTYPGHPLRIPTDGNLGECWADCH